MEDERGSHPSPERTEDASNTLTEPSHPSQQVHRDESAHIPDTLQQFLSVVGVVHSGPHNSTPDSLVRDPPDRFHSADISTSSYQIFTPANDVSSGHASHQDRRPYQRDADADADDLHELDKEEDEDIFESSFDLSEERLKFFFEMFDADKDGRISYESLRHGLDFHAGVGSLLGGNGQNQTRLALDERSFGILVQHLDLDKSGDICFEEFAEGIRLLMLRALFHPEVDASVTTQGGLSTIEVLDYNPNQLEARVVQDSATFDGDEKIYKVDKPMSRTDLYFKPMPSWVAARWINVIPTSSAAAALTLKRLAIKYSLHPLALDDALCSQTHRPKVEVFSNHYLIMVPIFSMDLSRKVKVKRRHASGYRSQRPSTADADAATKPLPKRSIHAPKISIQILSIFVNVPKNDTIITFSNPQTEHANNNHYWRKVRRELEKSYSKLRQYDAQYLTYALLDQAVDLVHPIATRMRHEISIEQAHLRYVGFRDSLERIHAIRHELEQVCRRIKPFLRVLDHCIEDEAISAGATIYLRDVLDNLECEEELLRDLIDKCRALDVEADKIQSQQMDSTLYTLTVVSSVFLPAQFLTGVWGMNFQNMSELDKKWAYPGMFWGLTGFMTVALLILFNFGRIRY